MAATRGKPLEGDRAAFDTVAHPAKHALDIKNAALLRHTPLPGTDGNYIRDNGANWVVQVGLPLTDFNDYARGVIIRGEAVDYEAYSAKTDKFVLIGDGTDVVSRALVAGDMTARGTGTVGRITMFGAGGDTVVDSFLVGPAANLLTLAAGGAYTLTVPESLTVAGRNVANTFVAVQTFNENILQADGKYIATDQVRARDGDGLKLYDDGGLGIFVQDGGYTGVLNNTPQVQFDVVGEMRATTGLNLGGAAGNVNYRTKFYHSVNSTYLDSVIAQAKIYLRAADAGSVLHTLAELDGSSQLVRLVRTIAEYDNASVNLVAGIQSALYIANYDTTNGNYASLQFLGNDTTPTTVTVGHLAMVMIDHTAGSLDTDFALIARRGGALVEIVRFKGTGEVGFNEVDPDAQFHVTVSGAAVIGQIIQLHSSPSENPLEVWASDDSVLSALTYTGGAEFSGVVTVGDGTNQLVISAGGVLTLEGTAQRVLAIRPEIDYVTQIAHAKPTQETRGVFKLYSFPVYAADDEQLIFHANVPGRWNGSSDITFHVLCALGGAEDVGDYFKFRLSWESTHAGEVVPATSHAVDVEQIVLAGRNAAYDEYELTFTIDWDADGGGNEVLNHDLLGATLYRVDATNPDVSNEIKVLDYHLHYPVNKMFAVA